MSHVSSERQVRNHTTRLWELGGTAGDGSRLLRLGRQVVALGDVVGFDAERCEARDRGGRMLGFMVFAVAAAIILFGVAELAWRTRFLLAMGAFAAMALMCLEDVIFSRPLRYVVVSVRTRRGERIEVTLADENEAEALVALLRQRV